MKSPTEILLSDIDALLERAGMAPSVFGDKALGDPNLVRDLRAGRELRHGTLMRVREYMASLEQETAA